MKKFVCTVCGYVHEGDAAPGEYLVCHQPGSGFREESAEDKTEISAAPKGESGEKTGESDRDLDYDKRFYRVDGSCRYMEEIHRMAVTGKPSAVRWGQRWQYQTGMISCRSRHSLIRRRWMTMPWCRQ